MAEFGIVAAAAEAWDIGTPAGFVALVLSAGALVALGLLWQSTAPRRVTAAASTMELRDEPPAVVDMLVGGFDVEDDAVPATVIDLAARGHLDVDEIGGKVTLRPRSGRRGDALTDYEQRLLVHIARNTVEGVAPAETLTIGPEGVSERWFRSFVREVNKHGQELGLCHRRFDFKHIVIAWVIVVVGGAPGWLVAALSPRTDDPTGWAAIGNLFVGMSLLIGFGLVWAAQRISRSNRQRDTDAGREAAAHWLGVRDHMRSSTSFESAPAASVAIWDRNLAYAVAMGLAPVAQRQLPFETEHDRHAWSRATGSWRRVKVRYRALVPNWGKSPGSVAFEGLLQMVVTGLLAVGAWYVAGYDFDVEGITDQQRRWIGLGALIVGAFAALAFLVALFRLVLGISDLFARSTVEGEVVRARRFRSGHRLPRLLQWALWSGRDDTTGLSRDHARRTFHHLAIDDGTDDSIVAYTVSSDIYNQARQGLRVRAVVTPRLGHVRSIEVLAGPRPSAVSDPVVSHQLVDEGVRAAGAAISGSMAGAFEQLESATDADGNPILDQVDDEGVSLRERMADSDDQLERMRNDPRIKNSPIAGLLDAFLTNQPPDDHT